MPIVRMLSLLCAAIFSLPSVAADGAITIDTHFQEVHRRLDDFDHPIVWTDHLTIMLSGRSDIKETWDSDSNYGLHTTNASNSVFGNEGMPYVWHILGPKKLERTQEFLQHTMTILVSIHPNNSCSISVVYKLKPGFSDMFVPRADNHQMAHFTLPRELSASCSIE